jgi:soluble lytic murein transglycosylase
VIFLRKLFVTTVCLLASVAAMPGLARAADVLPASLRNLAAASAHAESWPRLRSFAQCHKGSEWAGWAYFLAGYQEYEGQHYGDAAQDLAQAGRSGFSLADYAVYYQASALAQSGRRQEAAEALQDFSTRFPQSHLRFKALALRANTLLDAQQLEQAITVLASEPEIRQQPALSLLLGQARMRNHQPMEAVAAFQDVDYKYPLSSQAKAAADALKTLRAQLGQAYTPPNDEIRTARVDALFKAGRYDDSLKEYGQLIGEEPSSPMVARWQLGQAHCMLHLRKTADASRELATHYDAPDVEAQRLSLLVQVHSQETDAQGITQDLAQLDSSYANSPAYADALSSAGIFYYRQLNWQEAANTYRRLLELFPQNQHARDDGWRLAWCDYLLGDPKTSDVMRDYLMQYPDSAHAAGILFWLGRTQENQGSIADARALYALVTQRFVHSYYAPQAAAHLAALRGKPAAVAGPNDSAAAPLAASLIPLLIPPTIPPGLACLANAPVDASQPALILRALDLKNVEGDYLKAALINEHPPAEFHLLLSEVYAAQKVVSGALFDALRTLPSYTQVEFSDLPEEFWDYLYPRAYLKLIETQARLNHLDPYLVMGLIRQESAFTPHADSVSDARGLMQVLPKTAALIRHTSRTRVVGQRLYDPNYNVRVGCVFLAGLMKDFDNRPELAMAAYHAGDFRVNDWVKKYSFPDSATFLESIPIPATRVYVEQVLRDAEIYRQLLTGSPHFAKCAPGQSSTPPTAAGDVPHEQ